MEETYEIPYSKTVRFFAIGWALLSVAALVLSSWILFDLHRENEIVSRIVQHLPPSDKAVAEELTNDMRLQGSLSILLAVNIVGTAIAFVFVVRAYFTSEKSLRDERVLASDIRACIDAAIITTNRNGRITSINLQGRQMLGVPDQWSGQSLSELGQLNSEHAVLDRLCHEVISEHKVIRNYDYKVRGQAHIQTLRAGCTLLRNRRNEEIGTVVHVIDVTDKALIEDRLRRMERYMGLGSMAAGLQHEIRNPLSALSLHLQLLKEKIAEQPSNAPVDELLDVLYTEARRLNAVLESFDKYATMTTLGREPIDLPDLLEKLVRLLRPQAQLNNIEILLDSSLLGTDQSSARPILYADSVQLKQVFLNLALNAMAAMPRGGELRITIEGEQHFVHVNVCDTGEGIPASIQSQIFDPYFTTRPGGTGMGLALCDKIIRQHDGEISFSTSSNGTKFRVSLPLEPIE